MFSLGIIPARAGSKGIPGKNLCVVDGVSLMARAVASAKNSRELSDFIVTSDGDDILAAAGKAGASNLYRRSGQLAQDETPTLDVVVDAISYYRNQSGKMPDVVVLLQPTAPLRNSEDIDRSLEIFTKHASAKSLISVYDAVHVHPAIMYRDIGDGRGERFWKTQAVQRRQDFERVFVRNGAIYLTRTAWLLESRRLYDDTPLLYEMPRERSINIDEPVDFVIANAFSRYLTGDAV